MTNTVIGEHYHCCSSVWRRANDSRLHSNVWAVSYAPRAGDTMHPRGVAGPNRNSCPSARPMKHRPSTVMHPGVVTGPNMFTCTSVRPMRRRPSARGCRPASSRPWQRSDSPQRRRPHSPPGVSPRGATVATERAARSPRDVLVPHR